MLKNDCPRAPLGPSVSFTLQEEEFLVTLPLRCLGQDLTKEYLVWARPQSWKTR